MKAKITPSERRLLDLLKAGHTTKQMCDITGLKQTTIKTLLQRAYRALNVMNGEEALKVLEQQDLNPKGNTEK